MKVLLVIEVLIVLGVIWVSVALSSRSADNALDDMHVASSTNSLLKTVQAVRDTGASRVAADDIGVYYAWMDERLGEGTSQIWSQVVDSGEFYIPAVGMMEGLAKAVPDPSHARPLKTSELNLGIHMAQVTLPNSSVVVQAAGYTKAEYLRGDLELIERVDARSWLERMLMFEGTDGVVINPPTRFRREDCQSVYTSMNRIGVSELIGFLDANAAPPASAAGNRPFHELANEAFARESYYEVLYYWARSFRTPRPGDDWTQAEIAKLRSYDRLDFPGSRARARSELDWMIKNHPSPQLGPLRNEFARSD